MKVAWLCPYPLARLASLEGRLRPGPEHASTWIVTLANELIRSQPDLDLHIVTESTRVWCDVETEQDGIHFHVLRSPSCIPCTRRGWPEFLPLDAWTSLTSNVRKLQAAVTRIRPDLVHGHGTERAYGLAAVRSGFPAIVSIQGIVNEIYKDKPGRMWAVLRDLERQCVREGRHFVAKTPFARDFVKALNAGAVVYDIPNPVHPAFLRVEWKGGGGQRAIFVGSLVPEKGLDELIDAAAQVPGLELCIIGTGPSSYVASLCQGSRNLNVTWLGGVSVERVAEEMARSDVLVLPSHMETSPNVVAEAMCVGLPVIATNVGGLSTMVESGRTGILVDAGNAAGLRHALVNFIEQPIEARTMADRGRKLARRQFDPEDAARKTLDAYLPVQSG